MPILKSETIVKSYYRIGEVSALLSISQSKIRFYDETFRLNTRRSGRKARIFTDKDISMLSWIATAAKVYNLFVIREALVMYPSSRFLENQYLTQQEIEEILTNLKNEHRETTTP